VNFFFFEEKKEKKGETFRPQKKTKIGVFLSSKVVY